MLITLAIIGVVAALTIPTLVSNINEKSWDSANKVFRNRFEETMRVMNVNQQIAGFSTTEEFVNEFSKNMKIGKICDKDDLTSCFGEKFEFDGDEYEVADLKTSAKLGLSEWGTNVLGLMFDSGVSALITYDKNCVAVDPYTNITSKVTSCVAMLYDVNGTRNPNSLEKDIKKFGDISINNIQAPPLPDAIDVWFGTGSFVWDDENYTSFSGVSGNWTSYKNCTWNDDSHVGFTCADKWSCDKDTSLDSYWSCGRDGSHSGGID